jgi:hypothetical protein
MRSRFAACVRAPAAPLRGAGAPTRFARRKRLCEEEVTAARSRFTNPRPRGFDHASGESNKGLGEENTRAD